FSGFTVCTYHEGKHTHTHTYTHTHTHSYTLTHEHAHTHKDTYTHSVCPDGNRLRSIHTRLGPGRNQLVSRDILTHTHTHTHTRTHTHTHAPYTPVHLTCSSCFSTQCVHVFVVLFVYVRVCLCVCA